MLCDYRIPGIPGLKFSAAITCRAAPILLTLSLLGACTGLPRSSTGEDDVLLQSCARLYSATDTVVDAAGVRDAEASRLQGYPYLRSNRFLASLAPHADTIEKQAAWLQRLITLDQQGRRVELANLPEPDRHELAKLTGVDASRLPKQLDACAAAFMTRDLDRPGRIQIIKSLAQVRDEYSLVQRLLGLYWITRYGVYQGYQQWKAEHLQSFRVAHEDKQWQGRAVAWHPVERGAEQLDAAGVARIIASSRRMPLDIPEPAHDDLIALAQHFAPVFLIDEALPADRPGMPVLDDRGQPSFDSSRVTVHVRLSYAWFDNTLLPQLVYALWFPERPERSALDILSGKLDGIIWRVTIDNDGTPLIADSMHPCGCYHLFFPGAALEQKPRASAELAEDNEVAQRLPGRLPGQRHVIRIASLSHYLESISADDTVDIAHDHRGYELRVDHPVPDHSLRVMATADGGSASLYRPDGLVPGTQRRERWLLWPMGIKSAGAMRQWGKHATAFVGRRHFDDPYLFDKGFLRTGGDTAGR